MRRPALIAPLFLAALSLAGCATSSGSSGSTGGSRDVITAEQIAAMPDATTARQVIERLHPTWLRVRGTQSTGTVSGRDPTGQTVQAARSETIWVFVDNARYDNLRALDGVQAFSVEEIRFMSPREATTRYGTGYNNGIIVITTRR